MSTIRKAQLTFVQIKGIFQRSAEEGCSIGFPIHVALRSSHILVVLKQVQFPIQQLVNSLFFLSNNKRDMRKEE